MLPAFLLASGLMGQISTGPKDPVENFLSACLDGEIRWSKDEASRIKRRALPKALRKWWLTDEGLFYAINSNPASYLISFEQRPTADRYAKVCAVASPDINLSDANFRVVRAIKGDSKRYPDSFRGKKFASFSYPNPDEGYEFSAKTVGEYVVLQISWLNPSQIKAAKKAKAQVSPSPQPIK